MGSILPHETRINLINKDKDHHNITNITKNCIF